MLLHAPSSAGTPGSAGPVCVCVSVCFKVRNDQLLDALLCILNVWLSLLADLGPDVKFSGSHLRFLKASSRSCGF